MKKLFQRISSRTFYLILGLGIAIAVPMAYAAWNTTVSSGQTLSVNLWNDVVAKLVQLDNKIEAGRQGVIVY